MAKGTRGGQRGKVANAKLTSLQSQEDEDVKIDTTTQAEDFDKNFKDFMKMTEDEKIDAMSKAVLEDVPDHLANNDLQKVIYNLDFNDKPDLADDKTLDKMNGQELFRTINDAHDSKNDIHYTPKEIAQQVQMGSTTRVSDNGGSVYGRGVYFADRYNDSVTYGKAYNDINRTAVVRAKLNSNAKVINYYKAIQGVNDEIKNGTKLGKLLSSVDRDSKPSIYALTKGYNVITEGSGYYVVLNRKALTMSKDIKATNRGKGWK